MRIELRPSMPIAFDASAITASAVCAAALWAEAKAIRMARQAKRTIRDTMVTPPREFLFRGSVGDDPLARQRSCREACAVDLEDHVLDRHASALLDVSITCQAATDVGHRLARDHIVGADAEHDAIDRLERVREHKPLELGVVAFAPVRPGEEAPPDLERADLLRPVAELE